MFNLEAFADLLASSVPASEPVDLNRMNEKPDRLVVVREVPGLSLTATQEAFDHVCLQVASRSPRRDAKVARDVAHAIDRFLTDHDLTPFYLAGFYVLSAGRAGGPPTYMKTDNQERAIYVCNYWLQIER